MIKRKIVTGALVLSLILSGAVFAYAEDAPAFQVNGTSVAFNSETGLPYVSETNRTMMPLRACLNAIDCQVDWNQEEKTALLSKGDIKVTIPIGQSTIFVNEKQVKTDCPAVLKNGRTYLPLRAIMESFGYAVDWDNKTRTVHATELTASTINGGTTGIFSRRQLTFDGFDGIEGDVTLPYVNLAEKGDCPYVYFGFDWENDLGNVEGGFQFIEDEAHPGYNKWTVFMRQGASWLNGSNSYLEQGSKHHLKLYAENVSKNQADLVIQLDGREVVRKVSDRADFDKACAKAVVSMAMSKVFDGSNCFSQAKGAKLENVKVSKTGTDSYSDFYGYELYHKWNPSLGKSGMWFGTADCISSYLHYDQDGGVSIYKAN